MSLGKAFGSIFGTDAGADGDFATGLQVNTPAFSFSPHTKADGSVVGNFTANGTPAQNAFTEGFGRFNTGVSKFVEGFSPGSNAFDPNAFTSALTNVRRAALNDKEAETTTRLRDVLGNRRLSGSSFLANQLTKVGREFGKERAAGDVQSILDTLRGFTQAGQAQFSVIGQELSRELQRFNISSGLTQNVASLINDNAAAARNAAQGNAAGAAAVLGTIGRVIAAPFTGGASLAVPPPDIGGNFGGGGGADVGSQGFSQSPSPSAGNLQSGFGGFKPPSAFTFAGG